MSSNKVPWSTLRNSWSHTGMSSVLFSLFSSSSGGGGSSLWWVHHWITWGKKTHTHHFNPGNTFQWSYPVISTAFQTGAQGFKHHTKTVALCLVSMCLVSPAYFVNVIRNVFMSIIIDLHGFQFSYWVMSKSLLFEITAALQHKHELVEEAKRNRPSQSSAPTNVIIWFTGKNYLTKGKREQIACALPGNSEN